MQMTRFAVATLYNRARVLSGGTRFLFLALIVSLGLSSGFAQTVAFPGTGSITIKGSEQSTSQCNIYYCGPIYDQGLINITINGYTQGTSYDQNSTASQLASSLATLLTDDPNSPVTAIASGSTITLIARSTGASTNYSFSSTWSFDGNDFSSPSFTTITSGPTLIGGAYGGTPPQTRNFQMALWANERKADADIAFFYDDDFTPGYPPIPYPPVHAILEPMHWRDYENDDLADFQKYYWNGVVANLKNWHYDGSLIDAVILDEPYQGDGSTDPCDPTWQQATAKDYNFFQNVLAPAIKAWSPRTKFWISFNSNQVKWMQNPTCPAQLNGPFVDVVDMYLYDTDFITGVLPYYNWLAANLASSSSRLCPEPTLNSRPIALLALRQWTHNLPRKPQCLRRTSITPIP